MLRTHAPSKYTPLPPKFTKRFCSIRQLSAARKWMASPQYFQPAVGWYVPTPSIPSRKMLSPPLVSVKVNPDRATCEAPSSATSPSSSGTITSDAASASSGGQK